MKLSSWAKLQGITYRTAWNLFCQDKIPGAYKLESGTIIVPDKISQAKTERCVIYCRVSNQSRKQEMEYQVSRCIDFCSAKGYSVEKVYKEVASGMNDTRRELLNMLNSNPTIIVVENKDRLTRFGFNYLSLLLEKQNCKIEVIHNEDNDEHDIMKDMISIMTSFCCRLYGLRRGQNKANKIKEIIEENDQNN
jgi:predicted site-specific integrase-resolvase